MRELSYHPALPLLALVLGCTVTEPPTSSDPPPIPRKISALAASFSWSSATPESQGMCGGVKVLGCTKTLAQIWNDIRVSKYNTKSFVVIRNDVVVWKRGGTNAYNVFSSSKGLLGAPTLVHAMSSCRVRLADRASTWLSHSDGARWGTDYPWTDITVEQLASHTSGVCDYGNTSSVCGNENPGWQTRFESVSQRRLHDRTSSVGAEP